jgi:DNA-binding response OmpR family regulator
MPRLLLVEDDIGVRSTMEQILGDAGYEVETAKTVLMGNELIGHGKFDLVVTDGRLPDGHGLRIAILAREVGIPALIVTAYPFGVPLEWPVLQKPFRASELIAAAKKVLG